MTESVVERPEICNLNTEYGNDNGKYEYNNNDNKVENMTSDNTVEKVETKDLTIYDDHRYDDRTVVPAVDTILKTNFVMQGIVSVII